MAHLARRIAPALLASLSVTLVGVAARAETPAASSSHCLAKPSGPSAKGSHWYYRVEHSSGRHCWYQRPAIEGARNAPAHTRQPTESAAPPPPRASVPDP